jgi:hypothetical protein
LAVLTWSLCVADLLRGTPTLDWISGRLFYANTFVSNTLPSSATISVLSSIANTWGCPDGSFYDRLFVVSLRATMPIRQFVVSSHYICTDIFRCIQQQEC